MDFILIRVEADCGVKQMAKEGTVTLKGASAEYTFDFYPLNAKFKGDYSAVYAYTKRVVSDGKGRQTLLYIGETGELGVRHANHEKLPRVERYGGTHIAILGANETRRMEIEGDLLDAHAPPCND
jgi:hypothetical protein